MPTNTQPPQLQLRTSQNQQTQLSQRLMMSAHMQQALHLLQLPLQELESYIEEQVVQNPLLEIATDQESNGESQESIEKEEQEVTIDDKDLSILQHLEEDLREHFNESEPMPIKRSLEEEKLHTYMEQSLHMEPNLREQLLREAHDTFETEKEMEIAEVLIGYIDASGFLVTPLSEICSLHDFEEKELQNVLQAIQFFEPIGVGASSIQESLLIQLRCLQKENTLAYRIIKEYYEPLLHNHIPFIQKELKCSYEEIENAIQNDIACLDLHPGTHFSSTPLQSIVPDVTLRLENEQLIVDVEKEYGPRLRLNNRYFKMLQNPAISKETKFFIKKHVFSARWLMRNLQQRYSTLERITQLLAEKQYEFFTHPNGTLQPLTMKTIAEELNLHESTIARTVSNKYLFSPRGLFSLRSFFTTRYVSEEGDDLSAATVKEAIVDILSGEDKKHPFSDDKISDLLKQTGIPCARRTVAKYRSILQIGNAQQRRKFHG